jgi:hypothetical protein
MYSEVNPLSKLKLSAIYGERGEGVLPSGDIFYKGKGKDEGLRLKVWIKGEKNLTAAFLTCRSMFVGFS